ncbi:hypothetical protein F2Q70_00014454 [Brassica cretica]|uniref:Uncharacterized protein n=1 Tax=Brassica cretica TaxID=69181 RepID=A0A8S9HLQ3_BRACR|nr:hypothetical protein F2Q70_00014454 [Brassica cretica]
MYYGSLYGGLVFPEQIQVANPDIESLDVGDRQRRGVAEEIIRSLRDEEIAVRVVHEIEEGRETPFASEHPQHNTCLKTRCLPSPN